jgi:hypothetical protein
MEKIYFDDTTFIWKTKLNLKDSKQQIIKECNEVIDKLKGVAIHDAFGYKKDWNENIDFDGNFIIENKLDEILQIGIDLCKTLYKDEYKKEYNKVNADSWVNVVRSQNPVQINFKHNESNKIDKYHTHTELNREAHSFIPDYTYVYYIQMPDVMEGEDGVLYFKGSNGKEYWIRPEEDDLIIMKADMPHSPNNAPKSTIDRMVLAGNAGFEMIKKQKSII